MENSLDNLPARRLVLELLKQTGSGKPASLELLTALTRCSSGFAVDLLTRLGIAHREGQVSLCTRKRLDLAMRTARAGSLPEAGRYLSWQEFERFAEECLGEMGYETTRNVRVKAESRRWQIDVVGIRGALLLCFDCKHWSTHSPPSRFKTAAEHQVKVTRIIVRKFSLDRNQSLIGLPIILTLFEPPESLSEDVVLVSFQRLPSLLGDLTPYFPGLPFVIMDQNLAENPIKQGIGRGKQD